MANYANVPLGYKTTTQVPLNAKGYAGSETLLKDLGLNNNLAFTYEKGLVVYCTLEGTRWEWREPKVGEVGLLTSNFTYPNGIIAFGVDYSNKEYNFFSADITVPIIDGSETKVTAGTNITITGNGTTPTPYVISSTAVAGATPPLDKINEGNGLGIIVRGRDPLRYGNIGLNAVDLSNSYNNSSTRGATGQLSFTCCDSTTASGFAAYAEGTETVASGDYAHAEGATTTASGDGSHAEGNDSIASGFASHAEGNDTEASGSYSHSEGFVTIAMGEGSHSEGRQTTAQGNYSHAEGFNSDAIGIYSHAGGNDNTAQSYAETSIGYFGTQDLTGNPTTIVATDRLFNVGNGLNTGARSNAFTLLKNGLATLPSVTTALITAASGKAIITKEYLIAHNPQKDTVITSNYILTDVDNGTTIFVDTTAGAITITRDAGITVANFCVGFIHKAGVNDITFVGATNPVGLKSKGAGYQTFIERELATSNFYLLGNTKA
jgi:hypothetical protein